VDFSAATPSCAARRTAEDEAGGRGIADESAESAFGERDAAAGKRAVDLTGGELNLRHGGLTAERGSARLGTNAGGA
jgi:hypothetical protein